MDDAYTVLSKDVNKLIRPADQNKMQRSSEACWLLTFIVFEPVPNCSSTFSPISRIGQHENR